VADEESLHLLDRATAERILDEERGTLFNWLEFPQYLELEKGRVSEYPDRAWINSIVEMVKTDGQAAGVEQALTMPLRQANTTIEKPERDGSGRITSWIEEALFKPTTEGGMCTPLEEVIGQMTFASAVARTFHELVWCRQPDGKFGLRKIAYRPPGSCEIQRRRDNGELDGFKQYVEWDQQRTTPGVDWRGYVDIPANRAVIHLNGRHRDPVYGWSDLSVTHWAFELKRKIMLLWVTFLDGVSLPRVLAYGNGRDEARRNAQQIASLKSSGVAAVERSGDDQTAKMFDTLDMSGAGGEQFLSAMRYLDGMMSQSVLGGWMDLAGAASQSGAGSYALSADQSGLFLQSRHGSAREICHTINTQIILPLVRINFGPKAPVPLLKMEKIGSDQVAKAMELLSTLGSAQSMNVPAGFVDLLIERVAAYLDLPDDRVRKMIEENAKKEREREAAQGVPLPAPGTAEGNLQDAVAGALRTVAPAGPGEPAGPPPEEVAA
jgi:hypothetical protein